MNKNLIAAIAKWVAIFAVALLLIVYMRDYLHVSSHLSAANQSADPIFGSVMVQQYWEIPQKNGKVDYSFDPPRPQTCIHSIFPHGGYSACWYLNRHKLVRMAMGGSHESLQAAERIAAPSTPAGSVPKEVWPERSAMREAMKASASAAVA
jgi:hypothetical protein